MVDKLSDGIYRQLYEAGILTIFHFYSAYLKLLTSNNNASQRQHYTGVCQEANICRNPLYLYRAICSRVSQNVPTCISSFDIVHMAVSIPQGPPKKNS